jgi:superfamily I DNA/RNA helicase
VSTTIGASGLIVKAHRRFLDDAAKLPTEITAKVADVVRILREHGAYYPRLETRKLRGNPDGRFRLMDVDYFYRIVAVLEGDYVFLEKVGPHDPTERWGVTASLRDYEQRMEISAEAVERPGRRPDPEAGMFDLGPSLPEIAGSDAVSDVLADFSDEVFDGWVDGTIEDWMVFLSPVQRRAVDRAVGGPARVTGGPGTGKTVVGLHRAASFARAAEPGQRILLTSFVSTIPKVLEGLFERLAPDVVDRCDFSSVHALAMAVLGRGTVRPDHDAAKSRFAACLRRVPERYNLLRFRGRFTEEYLWEEVTRVIEGRGLESNGAYLALARHGRRRQMAPALRAALWGVYEEYRRACDSGPEPVADWDWILKLALDRVRDDGERTRYAAIVVDEAQDISEVGVRFLVNLLEGGSSGRLMLLGDGAQRIYPGGYRLSELGLEVRGRSFPLTVCYRSTDEIMQAVAALGRSISTEDFGEDGLRSLATSTRRVGPRPGLHAFKTAQEEVDWVLGQLDPDDLALDGTAILAFSNREVDRWQDLITGAGLGCVRLDKYSGRPVPGVKVGTFHRAKGLEFGRLFLPGLDAAFPYGDKSDLEALLMAASVLYVAMSRARDRLDISYAGMPSLLLEPVASYCDAEGGPPPLSGDSFSI